MAARELKVDRAILDGVGPHIESLKKTPDGLVLYGLIARGLQRYRQDGQVELAFIGFLNTILRKYAQDPDADAATRFKARLIRQRLMLDLPAHTSSGERRHRLIRAPAPEVSLPAAATPDPTRSRLQLPAEALQSLERALARETEAAAAHPDRAEPFDPMLAESLAALEHVGVDGDVDEIETLLRQDLAHLIRGHQLLGANLQRTHDYLKVVQNDRARLQKQLRQARMHSLVDESTGLANRNALLRQLDAEMARAQRHGSRFALALMAIDDFERIARASGMRAAESIVSCYATEIVHQFRSYDLAARCGESGFAVLFPGATETGAAAALEKVRKRLAQAVDEPDGRRDALPTFSAVITTRLGSETPAALLKRAEAALVQLRRQGTDRVETIASHRSPV